MAALTPVVWMTGVSVVAWLAVTLAVEAPVNPEVLLGMLGPLGSACATWVFVIRAQRQGPERVTRVLVAGFAAKLVFFGVYLIVAVRILDVRPVPFVAGFTSYIIGLYLMEALFLKRLFADGMRPSPGA